jgi:hypothetical protein
MEHSSQRVCSELLTRQALDPAKYAGHSFRAGHATSAALAGASKRSIMKPTATRACGRCGVTFGTAVCSGRTARARYAEQATPCASRSGRPTLFSRRAVTHFHLERLVDLLDCQERGRSDPD